MATASFLNNLFKSHASQQFHIERSIPHKRSFAQPNYIIQILQISFIWIIFSLQNGKQQHLILTYSFVIYTKLSQQSLSLATRHNIRQTKINSFGNDSKIDSFLQFIDLFIFLFFQIQLSNNQQHNNNTQHINQYKNLPILQVFIQFFKFKLKFKLQFILIYNLIVQKFKLASSQQSNNNYTQLMAKKPTQRSSDPTPKSAITNKLVQKNGEVNCSLLKSDIKYNKQCQMESKLKNMQKKSTQNYSKIQKKIDKMIEILQEGQLKMDIQQDQQSAKQKGINFIHNSFIYEKPLKSIKEDFIHFYKRLSSFSKQIIPADESIFQDNQFSLLKTKQQLQHFEKCLQNHYFKNGLFQSGKYLNLNLNLNYNQKGSQTPPESQEYFRQCYNISMRIKQSKYLQALHWLHNLPSSYKTLTVQMFQYDLKKAQVINRVKQKNYKGAFYFFKDQMKKFIPQNQAQLNKLLGYILSSCSWNQNLLVRQQSQLNLEEQNKNHNHLQINHQNQAKTKHQKQSLHSHININSQLDARYNFFTQQSQNTQDFNCQMAERFSCIYFCITGISKFDYLAICHEAGHKYMDKYIQLLGLLSKNQLAKIKRGHQKILPFSIDVDKQYLYHSLFLCPVTKEVLVSKQGVVLLQCGHLISEAATKLISEVRSRHSNKNKCPVCQKQRKQQLKKAYF